MPHQRFLLLGILSMADEPPAAFYHLYEDLPRQGPGDDATTLSLIDRIRPCLPILPDGQRLRMADMGCGSSISPLLLAGSFQADVTAVDLHQPFLDRLMATAEQHGLTDLVTPQAVDMLKSGITPGSLDLVWSEGSAFAVGFDLALDRWMDLLKPGGLLVVSDCSWLRADPPKTVRAFWDEAYPEMRTVGSNLQAAESLGYLFVHAEKLPHVGWEAGYYRPLEARMAELAEDAAADLSLRSVMAGVRAEIDIYRRFGDAYGYVYYILQRPLN